MADLTQEDILKLAYLARIELNEAEIAEFTAELGEILEYVKQLDDIDTAGLEPTSQVTGLVNVTRPDAVYDYGYPAGALLENVPAREGDLIKVKRMVG